MFVLLTQGYREIKAEAFHGQVARTAAAANSAPESATSTPTTVPESGTSTLQTDLWEYYDPSGSRSRTQGTGTGVACDIASRKSAFSGHTE